MNYHPLHDIVLSELKDSFNDFEFKDEKDEFETIYDICCDTMKFIQKAVIEELELRKKNKGKLQVGTTVIYQKVVHVVSEVTSGYAILTNLKTQKKTEPISAYSELTILLKAPENEKEFLENISEITKLKDIEFENEEPLFDLSETEEEDNED